METNDLNDGPQTVLAASGVPAMGDTYAFGNDSDTEATCIDVEVEATESPMVWMVTATYDTSRVFDLGILSPLNLPPEVSWTFSKYDWPLQRDGDGVPMVNSSSERFDPPLTVQQSRPVLTVRRNEASFSPALAALYIDSLNSDTFAGLPPLCAKINNIAEQRAIDMGLTYYQVTYEVEFKYDTWAMFVLDQGFRDFSGKLFRDPIDGSPLANATLLNGAGAALAKATSTLQHAMAITDNTLQVQTADFNRFPAIGPVAGTGAWYYELKVDKEIVQAYSDDNVNTFFVTRGWAGTTPAAHAIGAAVTMQPYFLRFLPYRVNAFAPLNLPTV